MKLDALARVLYSYIKTHSGQTILIKDIVNDTGMTNKTISKKIALLSENGFIRREGKKFFDLKG